MEVLIGVVNMKNDSDNSKTCAWLAYLLIGIIWYYADENMRKDNYVKFHVKQALVLLIFSIAWSILLGILGSILFIGFIGLWPIFMILSYVPLVFCILGIINAVNTKEKSLPVIGGFAKNLTF
jgi:uncharacterized membrane protein